MTDEPHADIHPLEAQRRSNRRLIAELGLPPYGERTEGVTPIAKAKDAYDPAADEDQQKHGKAPGFEDRRPRVRVAGRVMLARDTGKLVWLNLRDATGDLQVAVSQRDCAGPGFNLAKLTDLGDLLVADGPLMKTRTGEVTVWASSLIPAAKSLAPPPEKHAGLADVEIRYRQRYVDLWANPETLRVFELRSRIISRMRRFLDARGFMEVETPMLQTLAGGAAARPFVTHMNALGMPLYLRIAPELYLKRLLVGGMPKVYEINRNFRNEGLDKQHNPEFTMLEAYQAFGDAETVMELTESLIRDAARGVNAGADPRELDAAITFGEWRIDFGPPFDRVRYADLFERALGFSLRDAARCRSAFQERFHHLADQADRMDDAAIVNELFEEFAEKTLDPCRPTFITDYPAALSPLTRPRRDDPAFAERADLFVAHMELAPHYTELNDPDVQEARFREQLRGIDADTSAEEQTFRTMDRDFIRALKVGMPPAGGMGLGIDRLMMLLTNQRTIRDVVLFPLMRPED